MRGRFGGLLVALACVGGGLYAQNTIVFFASVVDDKGALLDLAADDLKELENGVEEDRQGRAHRLADQGAGADR